MAILDCQDKSSIKVLIKGLVNESKFYESHKLIKPWSFELIFKRDEDEIEYKEEV